MSSSEVWIFVKQIFSDRTEQLSQKIVESIEARNAVEFLSGLLVAIESSHLREEGDDEEAGSSGRMILRSASVPSRAIHWLSQNCYSAIDRITSNRRNANVDSDRIQRSIYNLAYGLSHEINNPLANISARAQVLLSRSKIEDDRKALATIIDQSQRAHEMLAEAMLVVQVPSTHHADFEIVSCIRCLAPQLKELCTVKGIGFSSQLPNCLFTLRGDIDSLQESIAIGIRNAIDACRAGDHIQLIVEAEWNEASGCNDCRLAIIDNGPGMSTKNAEQAWDLYFSGRDAGRGLGIGLAKLKRLIEGNDGKAWIETGADAGLALEMRFPIRCS